MEKTSILIVEDEFIIAKDIKMTLENMGYFVCAIVPSGEDAIKNVEKEKPDLILMDIILKGTMDGIEAARQIRSLFNIPIVYLTAYADENMVERAKITEPFGYVIKPFNDRDLNSAIKIALYRHKVEKKLKEGEERFRTLFEQANDSIFVHDLNGCFQDINARACTRLGYTRDELIQMKVSDIDLDFIPRDDEKRFWDTLPVTFESRHHRKDGSSFPVEVRLSRIMLREKRLVLSFVSDITERKRTAENEKLALVGQLAGRIAHDFNNMLGIIMGNTDLALLDCKDEKTRKTLALIFEQTLRGKNLTKKLAAFARDQEPKQEVFKISETINFVLCLLSKDLERIELIREDEPDLPDLLGDPEMIEHALFNLVQNSIHALSRVELPKIIIQTYCLGNNIYFEIQDNGCGIPEKYLKNICEPAFTLKGSKDITGSYKTGIKGAGYGLSSVKKFIEQHNGSILVESKFGSGSKFIIHLPVIKKELTNEEKMKILKET